MKRILVVEDELEIANIICETLMDEGYEVRVAGNGREALDRLSAFVPHVIITDYMMPVMDGAALYRHVSAQPAYQSIPFIVMSAVSRVPAQVQDATFLAKPFKLDTLIEAVSNVIG